VNLRRWGVRGALVALLVFPVLAACGGREGVETQIAEIEATTAALNQRPTATPIPMPPTVTPRPSPTPVDFDPRAVAGSDAAVSEPVFLPAGPIQFDITFDGSGPLVMVVRDVARDWRGVLLDNLELTAGRRVLLIPDDGEYTVEALRAEGDWQVTLTRPTPGNGNVREFPFDAAGEGPDVAYFLRAELGFFRMRVTHEGDGPIVVTAINVDRWTSHRLLTASGPFDDIVPFRPSGGRSNFIFDVVADGEWTIFVDRG
jgi:hypothetical protein